MNRSTSLATEALIALLASATLACAIAAREPIQPDCLAACDNACQNRVVIEFDVSPSGSVESPEVVQACPDNSFNYTALEAIEKWKYKPSPEGKQANQVRLVR